jgi:two-component system chemotaxis response regulator CheB
LRIINVVVIDDSAFMRKSISLMLESDPGIKVVATARDGQDGINKIREFRPDIVTLDIEMPVLDGLSALRIIMKEIPLPVIMISSLTSEGTHAMLDALNLGAVYAWLELLSGPSSLVNHGGAYLSALGTS